MRSQRLFLLLLVPLLTAAKPVPLKLVVSDRAKLHVVEDAQYAYGDLAKGDHAKLIDLVRRRVPLKKILFGDNGIPTIERIRTEIAGVDMEAEAADGVSQDLAGDCYRESVVSAIAQDNPQALATHFFGIRYEDGRPIAVPLTDDFVPELKKDGSFDVGILDFERVIQKGKPAKTVPIVRVVNSRFPVQESGQLAMQLAGHGEWYNVFHAQMRADKKGDWTSLGNGGNPTQELFALTGEKAQSITIKLGYLKGDGPKNRRRVGALFQKLQKAREEGLPVLVGSTFQSELKKRLKAMIYADLLPERAIDITFDSMNLIPGHAQVGEHFRVDPAYKVDQRNGKVIRDANGDPVRLTDEFGAPAFAARAIIRNQQDAVVPKGHHAIHFGPHGKTHGVFWLSAGLFGAAIDTVYLGKSIHDAGYLHQLEVVAR